MELAVTKRDVKQSAKSLRDKGILPAVAYGRKEESTPIAVETKVFDKVFRTAGESTVITLSGLGEEKDALIHDVVVHPVSGQTLHADFYIIEKGQKVTVAVPIEFDGESPAVKSGTAVLVKVLHELEIEVLPKELPQAIHIDISTLANIDDKIAVKDLKLPQSAIVTIDPEEVVVMVAEAKEEPVEETPMDISQIETSVERGKKEEEGAPAAEGEAKAE